jgi:hypothetical protein
MKKLLLLCMFLVMGCLLFAQGSKAIKAGNIMIGGDVRGTLDMGTDVDLDASGAVVDSSKKNILDIGLSAQGGYFIIDGLEAGIALQLGNQRQTDPNDSTTYVSLSTIGLGVQIAYYYDLGGMLAIYGKALAYYIMQPLETSFGGTKTNTSSSGFQVTPEAGIALFFNDKSALQVGIFFDYQNIRADKDPKTGTQPTRYGIKIGASIFI